MIPSFLSITLAILLAADTKLTTETPRKPNPFAPSLPLLSDEEEEALDAKIDRFIAQDIGQLKGEEGKKALAEFRNLGPEASFALIRGLNRAARIEESCPAVIIAKKLGALLGASTDMELLEFARENIGAGIERSRHMAVLKDLRVGVMLRKRSVMQQGIAFKPPPPPAVAALRAMSPEQLFDAAGNAQGKDRDQILRELKQRKPEDVLARLAELAGDATNKKGQELARLLLGDYLANQKPAQLKELLGHESPEIRAATARAVGSKKLRLGAELIDLLEDKEPGVRESAHRALVQLSGGKDFGPKAKADAQEQANAVAKWRDWWTKQGNR